MYFIIIKDYTHHYFWIYFFSIKDLNPHLISLHSLWTICLLLSIFFSKLMFQKNWEQKEPLYSKKQIFKPNMNSGPNEASFEKIH